MTSEKVYKVEFMSYTNVTKNVVARYRKDTNCNKTADYLDVGPSPFLVKESDLEKYREYGDGYRSIEFVGKIEV